MMKPPSHPSWGSKLHEAPSFQGTLTMASFSGLSFQSLTHLLEGGLHAVSGTVRCDWGTNPPHGYAGAVLHVPLEQPFHTGPPGRAARRLALGSPRPAALQRCCQWETSFLTFPFPSHYLCLGFSSIPVSESCCLSLPPSPTLNLNCSSALYSPTHFSTPHSQPCQSPPPPRTFPGRALHL